MNQINKDGLQPLLKILEAAFNKLNVDYYLIGALARDTWYARGNKKFRTTKDVDFAVMVGSNEEYDAIREYLREQEGFTESTTNAFVIIALDGTAIDLLPFGSLEIDEGVKVKGEGLTSINVNGFMEVYNEGTQELEVADGHSFQVATLPAIVLLKLIAYDDRPELRTKDVRDIANILIHYFELEANHIYEEHHDLFANDMSDQKLSEISAVVIGREIKKILGNNNALYKRINAIVNDHIFKGNHSGFIRNMAQETEMTIDEMTNLLSCLVAGLNDRLA